MIFHVKIKRSHCQICNLYRNQFESGKDVSMLTFLPSMSRRGFGGSSGTYNVRATELARDKRLKTLPYSVLFLDDSQQIFEVERRAKGQVLLDMVFQHLELIEKDYFGLQLPESGSSFEGTRWLDPSKSVKKQMRNKSGMPHFLFFRVKFYVSDPSKLQEEYTRYHFFLQIKRDILESRLIVPTSTSALLATELGDYNPEEHIHGYLSELRLIPNQVEELEKKSRNYINYISQNPADAEYNFLDHAKRLDMYGVDLHRARDSTNAEIQLGVTSVGLVLESYDSLLGFNIYRSCKILWKSCVEHHTFFRLHSPRQPTKKYFFTLGSKFRYRSPSKLFGRLTLPTISRDGAEEKKHPPPSKPIARMNGTNSHMRPYDSFNNKVVSATSKEPRKAWAEGDQSEDEGGFVADSREPTAFTPILPTKIGFVDDEDSISEPLYDVPSSYPNDVIICYLLRVLKAAVDQCFKVVNGFQHQPNGHETIGLVTIRMKPDEQGRFGFNVKGGADQNMPIIVSRVAPNTPADKCIPRLSEGDQVLFINGKDVSGYSHEQVVQLIRSSRETHTGELLLTVRPNVYVAEEIEEPAFQYVPDIPHVSSRVPRCDALAESILLLNEALESGAAIAQFDQLYRKKQGMVMNVAKMPENLSKNRYRDISPYDATRVVLTGGVNGDYINANHVNMEIPTSGIVNRYIAAQGPLPHTCADFWEMVWEQQSTLIVILTTITERGRIKCHQYWPDLYETVDYGMLQVTCHREEETPSFAFREFTLINIENNEERHITHMQYIAWPDHGVPEDSSDFLDFVMRVRQNRVGMVDPTIVHCSAGIGRTGVLILMETAMCLIEANEPVYPLDIVRNMRDQRAMLIQTASQYKFVCEAVAKVHNEGIVKPLTEFHR
uniref:Tyrosine-protein phosphatase n=1 Tax=Strigamia maritima TaxID=126957 RepID=T1J8E8_STRMM